MTLQVDLRSESSANITMVRLDLPDLNDDEESDKPAPPPPPESPPPADDALWEEIWSELSLSTEHEQRLRRLSSGGSSERLSNGAGGSSDSPRRAGR